MQGPVYPICTVIPWGLSSELEFVRENEKKCSRSISFAPYNRLVGTTVDLAFLSLAPKWLQGDWWLELEQWNLETNMENAKNAGTVTPGSFDSDYIKQ